MNNAMDAVWSYEQDDWIINQVSALTDQKRSISISEVAEEIRIMPKDSPFPGPVRMDRTPHLLEYQDDMSENSPVEVTVFMKSIQMGVTWAAENLMLTVIKEGMGPMLYGTATLALGKLWGEKRFDKMIEQAGLQNKIFSQSHKRQSKKSGDTSLSKEFPGGFLNIVGYNSAGSLRSTSFKYFIGDEIDEAPQDLKKQGSAIKIAEGRTVAYKASRKIILFSTPTEMESSQIYAAFIKGDQRYYNVPCPYCGRMQVLDFFKGIVFEREPDGTLIEETVGYKCENIDCARIIKNFHKADMLDKGKWVPTAKPVHKNYRSRHINALYAPPGMITWVDVVREYIAALDSNDQTDMKSFENLYLGLPYEERGEAPEYSQVIAHRKNYLSRTVPDGVVFLTLGADVQGDRIELEVVGHGRKYRTWSIEYLVIEGSTENAAQGAFARFKELFHEGYFVYDVEGGKMAPQLAFMDSNYKTDIVTEFCESCPGIYPIIGKDKFGVASKRFEIKELAATSLMHITIATNIYKDRLYSSLRVDHPGGDEIPPNYPSFPADYTDKYFKGLNAEYKRKKRVGNKVTYEYFCPSGRRNEPVDLRVYALCAADVMFKLSVDNSLKEKIEKFERGKGRRISVLEKVEMFFQYMESFSVF